MELAVWGPVVELAMAEEASGLQLVLVRVAAEELDDWVYHSHMAPVVLSELIETDSVNHRPFGIALPFLGANCRHTEFMQ